MLVDATVCAVLDALTITPTAVPPLVVGRLRQLQAALTDEAATDLSAPDAGHQASVQAALDVTAPQAPMPGPGNYAEQLQRLRALCDAELFRWTSASTQPQGPSGACVVALP